MITREEYLKALEVVESYKSQCSYEAKLIDYSILPIIKKMRDKLSVKAFNFMCQCAHENGYNPETMTINDVENFSLKMKNYRGLGVKTLAEIKDFCTELESILYK